jgi:hypothetical protein
MPAMKNYTPRIAAVFALTAGALLLTGCQASGPSFDRTLDVTAFPQATAPASSPAPTAGLDLHFGAATFGITCATDSVGDSTSGTTAVMCSWKTGGR